MGFFDSFWNNNTVKMLSHSMGPVPLDYEVEEVEKDKISKPLYKPLYAHLSEQEKWDMFETWMVKKGKAYRTVKEKRYRYEIYKDHMQLIERCCAVTRLEDQPCHTGLSLSADADLTDQEFRKQHGWPQIPN